MLNVRTQLLTNLKPSEDLGAHTIGWHDEWFFDLKEIEETLIEDESGAHLRFVECLSNTPTDGIGNSFYNSWKDAFGHFADIMLAHELGQADSDDAFLIKRIDGWLLIEFVTDARLAEINNKK